MRPRILLRTHYQVAEPAILRALIIDATTPTRTEYAETIAERLAATLKKADWDFNAAAGGYAVDLAKAAGLLTSTLGWTPRAHLLNLFADRDALGRPELSLPEALVIFATFFDADGAALLVLSEWLEKDGRLPKLDKSWNELANNLVLAAYERSMPLIEDVRDRTAVRQVIERRRRQPFSGRSGEHQGFVHAEVMHRVGLCQKQAEGRARVYTHLIIEPADSPTARFLTAVPNMRELEQAVRDRRWPAVAASAIRGLPGNGSSGQAAAQEMIEHAVLDYRTVTATGTTLCPLDTLIEAAQVRALATGHESATYSELLEIFRGWQRANPRTVRFHVDRQGRPAFLKLS